MAHTTPIHRITPFFLTTNTLCMPSDVKLFKKPASTGESIYHPRTESTLKHAPRCSLSAIREMCSVVSYQDNYMKGQAAVNTTRDYIRASVFFANTAIVLTTFIVGFAGVDIRSSNAGTNRPFFFVMPVFLNEHACRAIPLL